MCPPTHKFRFSSSVPAPDELEASHRPRRSRTALTIAEMNQDRDIKEVSGTFCKEHCKIVQLDHPLVLLAASRSQR